MDQQITSEERKRLAAEIGINEQYLYQCLTGRREMSPAEAMRIEVESGGRLTRRMLCQKSYAAIWPELADKPAAADAPTDPALDKAISEAAKAGLVERRSHIRRASNGAKKG